MGKFQIKTRKDGNYQFDLIANNGQVILTSQGYKSKESCKKGIESVKANSADSSRFEKSKAKNGQDYFNLKAANGQIIGTSQMYASTSGMETGIASVATNAGTAAIEELDTM